MLRLPAKIIDGRLVFTNREWVKMQIATLANADVEVVIRKPFRPVSKKQRGYYFGCVLPLVLDGLIDMGYDEVDDINDAHEIIKELFFKKTIFNKKLEQLEMVISITQANITEFEERMIKVRSWAQEYLGIIIPLPGTQAALNYEPVRQKPGDN